MDPYPKPYNLGFQNPYFNQMPIQQLPPPYTQESTMMTQAPQGLTTVVLTTVQSNVVIVPRPTYKDYLWLSILNMIFCFLPIGIAAVVFSCKTRDSVSRGDMDSATSNSHAAFNLNMVALGVGIAVHIIWIILVITYT